MVQKIVENESLIYIFSASNSRDGFRSFVDFNQRSARVRFCGICCGQ